MLKLNSACIGMGDAGKTYQRSSHIEEILVSNTTCAPHIFATGAGGILFSFLLHYTIKVQLFMCFKIYTKHTNIALIKIIQFHILFFYNVTELYPYQLVISCLVAAMSGVEADR